jgi:hypothetical protein
LENSQNFAICYSSFNLVHFGYIKYFIKIHNKVYCIVKQFEKKRNLSTDIDLETHIDKFFMIGKLGEDCKIISFNSIINKCTILANENLDEIFISRCVALKEHS